MTFITTNKGFRGNYRHAISSGKCPWDLITPFLGDQSNQSRSGNNPRQTHIMYEFDCSALDRPNLNSRGCIQKHGRSIATIRSLVGLPLKRLGWCDWISVDSWLISLTFTVLWFATSRSIGFAIYHIDGRFFALRQKTRLGVTPSPRRLGLGAFSFSIKCNPTLLSIEYSLRRAASNKIYPRDPNFYGRFSLKSSGISYILLLTCQSRLGFVFESLWVGRDSQVEGEWDRRCCCCWWWWWWWQWWG